LVQQDKLLKPYLNHFLERISLFQEMEKEVTQHESLLEFARSYKTLGINELNGEIIYREWAPGAKQIFLAGDFNGWNKNEFPLKKGGFGFWEIKLPLGTIPHNTKLRAFVLNNKDEWVDKIPVYTRYQV